MNEIQRQSYLKAMGLTPWVARQPLPGAAPSPSLDWPAPQPAEPTPVHDSAAVPPVSHPEAEKTPPTPPPPTPPPTPAPSTNTADGQPAPANSAIQKEAAQQKTADSETLTFTLEAQRAGQTWLLAAQEDSQAPGLGRFEAPLMASLLAVFQGRPQRPWRFYCPLSDQPMDCEGAAQALQAFVGNLLKQSGGEQVLLLLPESLSQPLFATPRYQRFTLADKPALVISSLAEMLNAPAKHKKTSWQAMQAHGFAGA